MRIHENTLLKLEHKDYLSQLLSFDWPSHIRSGSLQATVSITQPHGFTQEVQAEAHRIEDRGKIEIYYPLIDDGLYSGSRERDRDKEIDPALYNDGANQNLWTMGLYAFDVELSDSTNRLASGRVTLDPNTLFYRPNGCPRLYQVDSLRQFIECAPVSPVFINRRECLFTIRTIPERVEECRIELDVMKVGERKRMTPPRRLNLCSEAQTLRFSCREWPRGEYWLRVRLVRDGEPAGPYMVRRFSMECACEFENPELPLRLAQKPQYMVDGWLFAESEGLHHYPDQLTQLSDGPVLHIDQLWEQGSRMVAIESLAWDERQKQYRMTYYAGAIDLSSKILEKCNGELYHGTRYLCLCVSRDGVQWEKPDLGLTEFQGSKNNNILRDMREERHLFTGDYDSFPVQVKERPIPERYRYRFYDPEKDGPVHMDRFVLRLFQDFNMEQEHQFEGGFRPQKGEFWGMERRGDIFLVLTTEPVLREGRGSALQTTTERASSYPFEGDKVALFSNNGRGTSTYYDTRSKTFYYFFRPNWPAYPPHGYPSYALHIPAQIRTRAVMWTRDGFHWERRHMLAPDEHDPKGLTLYGFGFLRPVGNAVSDTDGRLLLGSMQHWDLRNQTPTHEMIWSRDQVNWHRFGENRKPLLPNGRLGSFNTTVRQISEYYTIQGPDGEEEWWFPYDAGSARYGFSDKGGARNPEEYRSLFPFLEEWPIFTTWEEIYSEASAPMDLPALARCKAGRLAHVAPTGEKGEFTTVPLVSEGTRLEINAHTDTGGSIRVEVQDIAGKAIPGFGLSECIPFCGDKVRMGVTWEQARLEELNNRIVRLRFVLRKASLYTFHIVQ